MGGPLAQLYVAILAYWLTLPRLVWDGGAGVPHFPTGIASGMIVRITAGHGRSRSLRPYRPRLGRRAYAALQEDTP